MKEVSSRQFILIALFLIIASKLMSMPTIMFDLAMNEAIFAIIFDMIIEILLVFLICEVIKRNQNTNLFGLLKTKFTKVFAYVIMFILYVFVLFKLVFILQELFAFFKEFLYDEFEPFMFGIPTFFVIGYLALKGPRTIGRTLEILFVFISIGLLISIISNVNFITMDTMQPYFANGFEGFWNGVSRGMFYFGNSIPLLFFVGKVKISKGFVKKVVSSTTVLGLLIIGFCFIFYDIYGMATIYTIFALSDFTQYDPFILDLQRINWLSTIVDVVKLFCSASILLYCLAEAGQSLSKAKSTLGPIIVSLVLVYVGAIIFNYDIETLKNLVNDYVSYITIGLMVLILVVGSIMCVKRRKNEKRNI